MDTIKKYYIYLITFMMLFLVLMLLMFGPVDIEFLKLLKIIIGMEEHVLFSKIIFSLRIPKIATAILAGGSLALSGLLMQTFFRNPLAGPFVLGVSSGASLGIALWLSISSLFINMVPSYILDLGAVTFSLIGSFLVLFLLVLISYKIHGKIILLVIGLVFGHLSGSLINVFIAVSDSHEIKSFLLWSLGSFSRVTLDQVYIFAVIVFFFTLASVLLAKQFNLLLLGEKYAQSLGVNLKKVNFLTILISSFLTAIVTVYCGPIIFVGIISPHLTRSVLKTSDHRILIPITIITGAVITLFAELIMTFSTISLPLNAIIGLLGAPVILWFVWQHRKMEAL